MFLAACCKFTCDGRSGFKLLYCYKRRRVITTTDVIMFGNYGLTPFLHFNCLEFGILSQFRLAFLMGMKCIFQLF